MDMICASERHLEENTEAFQYLALPTSCFNFLLGNFLNDILAVFSYASSSTRYPCQ